ncbi:hypothetical protein LCGC14_0389860 [marine sediment metagenome]|uniref:Uncharacterized protein n=1 Tax=marine sediment metagenome TaxID=412755 RepID=A0A0F9T5T3_9ZZZZ
MADRLDEIRERCKAFEKFYADDIKASRPSLAWKRDVEERKFVEHARVDLPWTLDRINRLERALEYAREWADNETWVEMHKIMNEEPDDG